MQEQKPVDSLIRYSVYIMAAYASFVGIRGCKLGYDYAKETAEPVYEKTKEAANSINNVIDSINKKLNPQQPSKLEQEANKQ